VFNLVASIFAAGWAQTRGLVGPGWHFWLTVFPFVFFTIFLSVPGLRAVARKIGDGRRDARNARRKALKTVIDANGKPLPAAPELDALLVPLEGEPEAGEGGQLLVRFPRVAEERAAVAKHLAAADLGAEKRIGKVIFGGDDDDVEKARAELEAESSTKGSVQRPRLKQ